MYNVIDVSKWQGDIEWRKVKEWCDGVIIRIGYRGYADGRIVKDAKADRNIQGCIENGIPYGIYFFSQAVNRDEGEAEAKAVMSWIRQHKTQPLYPIYIDSERSGAGGNTGRADRISIEARTEAIIGFCDHIEEWQYFAGVYRSTAWFNGMVNDDQIARFSHWVADYRGFNGYKKDHGMWQYSSKGNIDGIAGNVDMNYAYVDFPKIIKEKGLNGYTSPQSDTEGHTSDLQSEAGKDTGKEEDATEGISDAFTEKEKNFIIKVIKWIIKMLGV